ncbi:MAG: hypothetical protein AAF500_08600 [Myxococcota bacterium]
MSTFDVWVMRFEPGDVPPADRVAHAFGVDETTARSLVRSLPRVVKHGVAAPKAGEMRKVLESIGAEVECRPARRSKPVTNPNGAVFQKPQDDLLPGRISAIDPFAQSSARGARISVDDSGASVPPTTQSEISGVVPPPSAVPPRMATSARAVDDAIRSRSLERQRKTFVRRAVGAIISGLVLAVIGLVVGNSVFTGSANWFGIGVDGLAIYFVGAGGWDLYNTLRS